MSYQFNISEMGLRLIKAYEGFVPDGRLIRDGRKIVGYGRVTDDLDMVVSEKDAENMLKDDLATIEDLINTNVHASMTQSQFDALCSLAYSIGPDAFLRSNVLHALNRGEVITAANNIDGWRLGNIDGQLYVVDALVRRRTAEKALFLRPTQRTVPAPHEALPAFRDNTATDEQLASSSSAKNQNVAKANVVTLFQDQGEVLELENNIDNEQEEPTEAEVLTLSEEDDDNYTSPIAEAAAEVSERLDALMDKDSEDNQEDWPESFVSDESSVPFDDGFTHETQDFHHEIYDEDSEPHSTAPLELTEAELDDIQLYDSDGRYASADKYIQPGVTTEKQNMWTFITMIILGLTAAGGGLWANMKSSTYFGEISPLIWSAGVAIGVLLLLVGVYYLMKQIFGRA